MVQDEVPDIGRRSFVKTIGAAGVSAALAGCNSQNEASSPTASGGGSTESATETPTPYDPTHSMVGVGFASIPYMSALNETLPTQANGAYGGEVQLVDGSQIAMQSLLAGSLEVYTGGLGNVFSSAASGNEIKVFFTKLAGTDYVMAVKDSVSSLNDFAEQDLRFGISTPGALSHIQPIGIFSQEEVDYGEIEFVQIGGSSTRTTALAAGNIDGAALHLGQLEQLQSEGQNVKSLGRVTDWYPNFVQECVATTSELYNQHKSYFNNFTLALMKSHQRAMNDFEWVYEQAEMYQTSPMERETARSSWELNKEIDAWPTDTFGVEAGYRGVKEIMVEGDVLSDPDAVPLEDIITTDSFEWAQERM